MAEVEVASPTTTAPWKLNAFDLINACGGTALNRMLLTQSERQVKKVSQFTSVKGLTPIQVLDGIDEVLQGMGCDTRVQHSASKVKGALLTSSGMIGIIIQSYFISPTVHLIEIRRGKGDILEYFKLYNELIGSKIGHLVNVPATALSPSSAAETSAPAPAAAAAASAASAASS
eukprot:FR742335.1.p1 GENE.FR742335.1~~FR742335.1.p1  ORF type:complete len:196 (+),score=24.27 FR742335.1:68-589(+)